mgnify:CR=1 FL=1
MKAACVGRQLDPATGRTSYRYKCAACGSSFKRDEVQVDHIDPVVDPHRANTTINWNVYIERLLCEVDNLQVLCSNCHLDKSNLETQVRKKARKK